MIYKNFYSEVGKLLYALAKADGSITLEEVNLIHKLVLKDMVPLESSTDEFGTDSAFYIEMEFDYLNENFHDPDVAFNSFIDYVDEHYTAFNDTLKYAVYNIANTLTHSYHETNIKDHYMMEKLKKVLHLQKDAVHV
ncbi:MAG: hypothetical protein ACI85Q_000706 [Salibacteraceae bacterium]|jgi:hypothetical protein